MKGQAKVVSLLLSSSPDVNLTNNVLFLFLYALIISSLYPFLSFPFSLSLFLSLQYLPLPLFSKGSLFFKYLDRKSLPLSKECPLSLYLSLSLPLFLSFSLSLFLINHFLSGTTTPCSFLSFFPSKKKNLSFFTTSLLTFS